MLRRQFLGLTMAALTPLWRAAARQDSVLELEGVRPFIESMRAESGFSAAELEALFAGLQVDERVITLMERPRDRSKKIYWREYRRRQLSGEKIIGGAQFMRRHSDLLARAETTYGVPAAIVAAILGVETNYGKVLGRFHIVRALATLAFAYPRRAEEFQKQLREFLLYARQGNMDPLQLRGSFAGAFGWPQFLPGSARRFAVDFDGDGRADLFSPADAVGSVGNFLQQHGWLRDAPVAYPLSSVADPESLTAASKARGYKPFFVARRSRRRRSACRGAKLPTAFIFWWIWKTATILNTVLAAKISTRSRATTKVSNTPPPSLTCRARWTKSGNSRRWRRNREIPAFAGMGEGFLV